MIRFHRKDGRGVKFNKRKEKHIIVNSNQLITSFLDNASTEPIVGFHEELEILGLEHFLQLGRLSLRHGQRKNQGCLHQR